MFKKYHLLSAFIVLLSGCNLNDSSSSKNESAIEETESPNTKQPLTWLPNAGSATSEFDPDFPFLQFIPDLDLSELSKASQGRELFVAQWAAAPGTRPLLDGLGPLTITSACSDCHLSSGRAASLNTNGEVSIGLLFRLRDSLGNADPYYGAAKAK
jgi:CxxC motif-containing protein (DUF1111 family)